MRDNSQSNTSTPAIDALRALGIPFGEHRFAYVDGGGTSHSSQILGVAEHAVIKTLIFDTAPSSPVVVLMHGDRQVDTKLLAAALGCRKAFPCDKAKATELTGYLIGGTSPFGLKTKLPIYGERSIKDLERIWINGGARGFLVDMVPTDLEKAVQPTWISVGKVSTPKAQP